MNKLKIYTAGGFHGDWRNRLKSKLKETLVDVEKAVESLLDQDWTVVKVIND